MRWLRYLVILILAVAALVAVAILVLFNSDLSGFEDDLESFVSERTGRNFQIDGTFEPSLGENIELVASEVTLGNAEWGVAEEAISIERLHVSISLRSLFDGPVIVRRLEVDGLTINIEKEPNTGQSNLSFADRNEGEPRASSSAEGPIPVVFEHARIESSEIHYGQGWLESPRLFAVREASITGDPGELLNIHVDASIDNDVPVAGSGTVGPLESLIAAEDVRWDLGLSVGQFETSTVGSIADVRALEGANFDIDIKGPSARQLLERLGLPIFAEGEIDLRAGVAETDDGVHAVVEGSFGELRALVNMQADTLTGMRDGQFDLEVSGPNVQVVSVFADVGDLPAVAFSIATSASAVDGTISLRSLSAEMDSNRLDASGVVERPGEFRSATFDIDLAGPNAAEMFRPWLEMDLPAEPYRISGNLGYDGRALAFTNMEVSVERLSASFDGTTGDLPSLDGLSIAANMASSDTRVLREWLQNVAPDFSLPATAMRIEARVSRDRSGWRLQDTEVTSGEHRFTLAGDLGALDGLPGVDVVLTAEGPDLRDYYNGPTWAEPVRYRLGGHISATENLLSFADVVAEIGEAKAAIDGSLPISMQLDDVDARIELEIPDLGIVSPFVKIDGLQGGPFVFSGSLSRRGSEYVARELLASLGDSDIRGDLAVEIAERPKIVGRLQSTSLDLAPYLPPNNEATEVAPATTSGRVIPDVQLPLELMDLAEIDLELVIGDLRTRRYDIGDVDLRVQMDPDSLRLQTGQVSLANGGDISVAVDAQRHAAGADVRLRVVGNDFNLRKLLDEQGSEVERPPMDLDLELEGRGDSLHDLAGTANGSVRLNLAAGQLDNQLSGLLMRDVLAQVMGAINPLSQSTRYSRLECGIADLDIVDGVLTTNVLAARTPQLSVASVGTVNLTTEEINFSFRTRQREGIGVSVAGAINPFFRLAGTLGEPAIQVDARRGFFSGAIAALTGGVSILAQGVFDRYLAEDNLCEAVAAGLESGELTQLAQ